MNDDEEDLDWGLLTERGFFSGYALSDSIYDDLSESDTQGPVSP